MQLECKRALSEDCSQLALGPASPENLIALLVRAAIGTFNGDQSFSRHPWNERRALRGSS